MINKQSIDLKVASDLGISERTVMTITEAFLAGTRQALVSHGGVHLQGLGKLVVRFVKGSNNVRKDEAPEPTSIKIYFSKSRLLKDQIMRSQLGKEPSYESE